MMNTKKLEAAQTVATRLTSLMAKQLTVICPLTGLLVSNDLPPAIGLYINSYHPIALPENAKLILKDREYWRTLNKENKAALILSVLNAYNHLSLEAPSIVIKGLIETNLNVNQLNGFLEFCADYMATTVNGWPILSLGRDLNEHTFLDYMNRCAFIEYQLADEGEKKLVEVPKFVTSDKRGTVLDKECYEEWLEAAPHLPKEFVAKAAPFIRTIATNPSSTVDSMLAVVKDKALMLSNEVAPEVDWFLEAAHKNREVAKNLGLHKVFEDLELFDTPPTSTAPTTCTSNMVEIDLSAIDEVVEPVAVVVEKELTPFQRRMAALRSKQV